VRHFLDFLSLDSATPAELLADALARKKARIGWPKGQPDPDQPLAGHVLAMIFEKPSTRTRVSFDVAMRQLGGSTLNLGGGELQLGRGETIADTARVLSRYVDAIMIRTSDHMKLTELAAYASVPVINGLTDFNHPCQALADVLTVHENFGEVKGTNWAWLGDGNNMANSLIEAAIAFDFKLRLACAPGYEPDAALVARAGASAVLLESAAAAVLNAEVVVTDTWISMGQAGSDTKLAAMEPYQVTPNLMTNAAPQAIFLHCLPAHRGEEMTVDVIDGPQSRVWDEAENRLHVQKAILRWCLMVGA
jgi:ornithine carbamoyltransferase